MTASAPRNTREVVEAWIRAFQVRSPERLAALYAPNATNWQVADEPVQGREAIQAMFTAFFQAFPDSYTDPVNLMVEGNWAACEWSGGGTFSGDLGPLRATGRSYRLRGCGIFMIRDGQIIEQRGYWDKRTWASQLGVDLDASLR
ncbi:MAG: SgcJ/EcaC family oxidoreductase [Nevskiales bacterium]|nr:SgcJ/EcaC family oxidoreductase [Nevskiales bacterium]